MRVSDILALCPEATGIVAEYGLHCFSCASNTMETLEEGCQSHGFTDDDIDDLVTDLNTLLRERPERPATLTVTESAAKALQDIAESEGKKTEGLAVIADEHGGFCMEFRSAAEKGDKIFGHEEVPRLKVFASVLTLQRIGGSRIDYREGRFKLDMEGDACGCGSGECGCREQESGNREPGVE